MNHTNDEAAYLAAAHLGDHAEVDRLEPLIDAREQRLRAPDALAQAAAWYAAHGIAVFPLRAGTKIPMPGTRGFHDATTDPTLVTAWWGRIPNANIGLPTGQLFDVVDVDGPQGQDSIAPYLDQLDILGVARTARHGGMHLYVPPTGHGNKAGVYPGVDFRGAGGYVVAPPSIAASGERYDWTQPLDLNRLTQHGGDAA